MSTCSEYFEEIFTNIECKHPFVVIKDIDASEFDALLNYMYLGEVNVLQDVLPNLIKAAEALRIKGLAVCDDDSISKEIETPKTANNINRKRERDNSASDSSWIPKKKPLNNEKQNKKNQNPSENLIINNVQSLNKDGLEDNAMKNEVTIKICEHI